MRSRLLRKNGRAGCPTYDRPTHSCLVGRAPSPVPNGAIRTKRISPLSLALCFIAFCMALPWTKSSFAVDISSTDLVGLRGGFWKVEKAGELPSTIEARTYTPYLEFSISQGIRKGFSLEFNFGAGYRGDTKFIFPEGTYWENWNLYPISGKVKYSFFSVYPQKVFQPYLDLGLTFLTSTSSYNNPYYLDITYVRTKSTFGALAGWGLDLSLSPRILFNLDFQYRWVSFNKEVAGIKNYSGPQLTFGLEYIIKQKRTKDLNKF